MKGIALVTCSLFLIGNEIISYMAALMLGVELIAVIMKARIEK